MYVCICIITCFYIPAVHGAQACQFSMSLSYVRSILKLMNQVSFDTSGCDPQVCRRSLILCVCVCVYIYLLRVLTQAVEDVTH